NDAVMEQVVGINYIRHCACAGTDHPWTRQSDGDRHGDDSLRFVCTGNLWHVLEKGDDGRWSCFHVERTDYRPPLADCRTSFRFAPHLHWAAGVCDYTACSDIHHKW